MGLPRGWDTSGPVGIYRAQGTQPPLPQTGLMVACYRGFGSVVALLSHCPFLDVNQQDKEGDTALMLAAQAGARLLAPPSAHLCLQTGPQLYTLCQVSSHPRLCCVGRRVGLRLHTPFLGIQDLPSVLCRPCVSGESPAQLLRGPGLGAPRPAGADSTDEGRHSGPL